MYDVASDDPQVGYLAADGETPVYQAEGGALYYYADPPKRFLMYKQVEFLQMPRGPVRRDYPTPQPQQPRRRRYQP
jgi:hypothetical protein